MKAKPITYKGINFRSKLEARWHNFFEEECGFNITYEPDVEGVINYIPDLKIKGRLFDIYVEIKPLETLDEWFESKYDEQRTKLVNSKLVTSEHSVLDYFKTCGGEGRRRLNLPKLFDELKDNLTVALSTSSPTPFVLNHTQLQEDQKEEFFNLVIDQANKDKRYGFLKYFCGENWRDWKKDPGLYKVGFFNDPKKLKDKRLLLVVGNNIPQYLGKEDPFGVIYPLTDIILKTPNVYTSVFLVEGHVSGSDYRHLTNYYENNYAYDMSSGAGSSLWGQIVSGQFWNPPETDCNGNKEEFKKNLQTSWNKSWSRLQWKGQGA